MIDKFRLSKSLSEAIDKAASYAIKQGMPIANSPGSSWVGQTVVKKNSNGMYDILTLKNQLIYKDISVFDVAVIVAQKYSNGEFKTLRKVLVLEHTFSKYHTEMLHYLHCIKGAKRRRDYTTMAILEDKFQMSEIRAKNIRDNIAIFKRLK